MTDQNADANADALRKMLAGGDDLGPFLRHLEQIEHELPSRVNADPENVEKGLVQLVLTLVELLRQLMERQAVRRMEGGSLNEDEIERLGQTFQKLDQRMEELRKHFGLSKEDLSLHLGPLGDLTRNQE